MQHYFTTAELCIQPNAIPQDVADKLWKFHILPMNAVRHALGAPITASEIITDLRKPNPLPAEFMSGLMARCDTVGVVTAPPDLEIGDTIRVLSGPFAEAVARIEQFTDDERLQILMDLMGQKTRVSVSMKRVEKL
jgi:transcription antitermination factor NusG